jgi:hypothetical protein
MRGSPHPARTCETCAEGDPRHAPQEGVHRVVLADFKANKRDEGAIEIEVDDGVMIRIDPPELWPDEAMAAAVGKTMWSVWPRRSSAARTSTRSSLLPAVAPRPSSRRSSLRFTASTWGNRRPPRAPSRARGGDRSRPVALLRSRPARPRIPPVVVAAVRVASAICLQIRLQRKRCTAIAARWGCRRTAARVCHRPVLQAANWQRAGDKKSAAAQADSSDLVSIGAANERRSGGKLYTVSSSMRKTRASGAG